MLLLSIMTADFFFFFQAEDGIRDTDRSRGLGDVYKRQDYQGISVVLIEHKMDVVMTISHKVMVLNFGETIAFGHP